MDTTTTTSTSRNDSNANEETEGVAASSRQDNCHPNDNNDDDDVIQLRERIRVLEQENARLKAATTSTKTSTGITPMTNVKHIEENGLPVYSSSSSSSFQGELSAQQIERYSRQLLLHGGFGVKGQRKLLDSKVLVVGAGGIGSTGRNTVWNAFNERDLSF